MEQLHHAQLYLYDPAVGSVQTIEAAYGLLSFDIDHRHIAWAGGAGWNECYLYDLAGSATERVATGSEQNGEFVVVKGDILAWTGRTGERTTLEVHRLDTSDQRGVDEFGPFNPMLQSDGRHVAWNRGEEATGPEVWVYDTESGDTVDLGGTSPSIDEGRVAWLQFFPGRGREVVMVRNLAGGPATQLTNSRWGDRPPVVSGDHVVWARGYEPGYPGAAGPELHPKDPLLLNDFCVLVGRVLGTAVADAETPNSVGSLSRALMTESGWQWEYSALATRAEAAQILWNTAGAYLEP